MITKNKIVVTGATGFLGKKLVYTLKAMNLNPVALGRNQSIGNQFINDGIPFLSLDLTDKEKTISAFTDAEYVINCAGLSSVWGAQSEFTKANVVAVKNVIEGCQINGIKRLIHISTPSLYFDYSDRYDLTEESPLPSRFVNNYAQSKKEGEVLIQEAHYMGLPTVILRPRGIFGPGDTAIFPRILTAMKKNKLPLIEQGRALMDITYVDNVVDSIILAMESENIEGQIYNITNGEPRTFINLLQMLSGKLEIPLRTKNISFRSAYYSSLLIESLYRAFRIKKEPPITCYGVGLVSKSMTFDIRKAQKELGYAPKISIEKGMDIFALWWRSQ